MQNIEFHVNGLTKQFRVFERSAGLSGTIKNLFSRNYNYKTAVNDLSFDLYEGDILGFIGPNGSGKTTSLKLMSGIMSPTSGFIYFEGKDVFNNRKNIVKNLGVMFAQRSNLIWDLSVQESLKMINQLYESPIAYEFLISEYSKICNIEELLKIPVRKLSLGQRTLCEVISTAIYNPKVIFLDEPSVGLDFYAKEQVYSLIKYLNQQKKITFVITSHNLNDIEQLANRILLISKGKKIYDGTVDSVLELGNKLKHKIIFKLNTNIFQNRLVADYLKKIYEIDLRIKNNQTLEVELNNDKNIKIKVIKYIIENFDEISDIEFIKPSLEDIIKYLYDERKMYD